MRLLVEGENGRVFTNDRRSLIIGGETFGSEGKGFVRLNFATSQ